MRLGLLGTLIWIFTLASADAQDHPPLGKLIDAGGYRVHLCCVGSGSPAVVIVGAGYSFDWALVQPTFLNSLRFVLITIPALLGAIPVQLIRAHSELVRYIRRKKVQRFRVHSCSLDTHLAHLSPDCTRPNTPTKSIVPAAPNPTPVQKLPFVDYQLHLWANSLPEVSKTMQRNIQVTPECSSNVEEASRNKAVPFFDKPLIVPQDGHFHTGL